METQNPFTNPSIPDDQFNRIARIMESCTGCRLKENVLKRLWPEWFGDRTMGKGVVELAFAAAALAREVPVPTLTEVKDGPVQNPVKSNTPTPAPEIAPELEEEAKRQQIPPAPSVPGTTITKPLPAPEKRIRTEDPADALGRSPKDVPAIEVAESIQRDGSYAKDLSIGYRETPDERIAKITAGTPTFPMPDQPIERVDMRLNCQTPGRIADGTLAVGKAEAETPVPIKKIPFGETTKAGQNLDPRHNLKPPARPSGPVASDIPEHMILDAPFGKVVTLSALTKLAGVHHKALTHRGDERKMRLLKNPEGPGKVYTLENARVLLGTFR